MYMQAIANMHGNYSSTCKSLPIVILPLKKVPVVNTTVLHLMILPDPVKKKYTHD